MSTFVGRTVDSERLAFWASGAAWTNDTRRLHVGAVCGPGGVGKTRLAYHALDDLVLAAAKFLVLKITGGEHPGVQDVFSWVEWLVGSATELRARARNAFSRTRQHLEYQRELSHRLVEDLRKRQLDEPTIDGAKILFGLGRLSEKLLKQDIRGLLKKETVDDLKVMREAAESGPVRSLARFAADVPRRQFRRFRDNRLARLADAFVDDLEELLTRAKPTPEFSRLLLIIDDYEFLDPIIGTFLTEELLPRLRSSTARGPDIDFQSLVLIIGRDELTNTGGAIWQQAPLREDLGDRQLVLAPLSQDEVDALCKSKGRDGRSAAFVYQASQGYPWLAELIVDEMKPDGTIPAIVYTNFLERMSRFMTSQQRGWFKRLCFLDRITVEGIEVIIDFSGSPGFGAKDVLEWFRHEPSIRDTKGAYHTVWPFVRERVLMAQWIDSPRDFATLAQKADLEYDKKHGPALSQVRPRVHGHTATAPDVRGD